MQFLPATFAHAARLADIADPDICDPADAIPAAAAYLRSNGAPRDWERALYRYNPADWYPPLVLRQAARYGHGTPTVWPVPGARISQRFGPSAFTGAAAGCWRGRCYAHFHDGLDLAAPVGTPVVAIAAGQVTLAGQVADGAVVVMVDHGAGVESLYGHLEPALAVRTGDLVAAGTPLGSIGLTGRTTGPHLHLEILVSGEPIDPLDFLPSESP
jgi:murein DD-endopeptidase MepM/ murein hydrolase activator NlpD